LTLIAGVLLAIGLAAYLLGLTIVRPLGRLTQGATRVAGGDLDVNLPIDGRSEVSYMTEVFNDMVARLRRFRDENAAINHQLLERNEELRRLSITDSLTGLYNRTQLPEVLARELARSQRHERRFSILMIDIDHFKRFNDAHGHQAGDELLRQFAEILKGSIRACDFAARFGGEEFLVLLTETDPEGAFRLAESLRGSAEALRPHGEARFTISIGVASYPQNGDDVESLIRQADDALYDSKRMGRNLVVAASGGGGCERPSRVSSG
jgi:diguanylate cyclase (GGDEF)-like protein